MPSGLKEEKRKKEKEKTENAKTRQTHVNKKVEIRKEEIRIACHNVNGLKTRGWKLENLLGWTEKEEIAILGITETNIAERERKCLLYNCNMQYKGYWTSVISEKKKGSGIGILIDEKWKNM